MPLETSNAKEKNTNLFLGSETLYEKKESDLRCGAVLAVKTVQNGKKYEFSLHFSQGYF